MSSWKRFFSLMVLAILLVGMSTGFMACTEDDDETTVSYDPIVVEGESDVNGEVDVVMGDYTVEVMIQDGEGNPVPAVDVTAFQGESVLVLWALGEGYYSDMTIIELTGQATVTLTVTLLPTEGYVLEPGAAIAGLSALFADASVTEHCGEGTLADLLTQINEWALPFLFFSLDGAVAGLSGQDVINLYMMMSGMNQDIFDELLFGQASLIPGDVISYCWYTITVDDVDYALPLLHINQVISQATPYDYKFIVTWGENPRDLDSHLYTPVIDGSAYHVYYGMRGSAGTAPYAWLDVDDVSSYGPEAVTIEELYPGTYTYAIYEFSGSETLTESEAHVQVFNGRMLVDEYDIPTDVQAGDNWWWTLGTVDGDTGAWTEINVVADAPVLPAASGHTVTEMPMK